jgi:hypothetical protein
MMTMHPHLWHFLAYSMLTILAVRISLRMSLTVRLGSLVARDGALRRSKKRLIELLTLEAIQVSPLEAFVIVLAHVMLVTGSGLLLLAG